MERVIFFTQRIAGSPFPSYFDHRLWENRSKTFQRFESMGVTGMPTLFDPTFLAQTKPIDLHIWRTVNGKP
jgi:hypothetical protein